MHKINNKMSYLEYTNDPDEIRQFLLDNHLTEGLYMNGDMALIDNVDEALEFFEGYIENGYSIVSGEYLKEHERLRQHLFDMIPERDLYIWSDSRVIAAVKYGGEWGLFLFH